MNTIIITDKDRQLRAELAERVLVAVLGEGYDPIRGDFHPLGWTRTLVQFTGAIDNPDDEDPEATVEMLAQVGGMVAAIDAAKRAFEDQWVEARLSDDGLTLDISDVTGEEALEEAQDLAARWLCVSSDRSVIPPFPYPIPRVDLDTEIGW
ncbi:MULTISPECIES: hypothetical protein [Methylopilaceae]|uniref:Uncharacterized protein n=2 Tax=Methylopilaceae TaxID=3149309 RepID=A0A4Q0M9P9_9HYPH|nr:MULTISPECIES: hypothetical protein [Methylocystaceae]QZO00598.1 hypothetical protein K6K41_02410 [Chenggangzhangella methanolivorans]RXF69940.1 hypothetical protein EK403_17560 [Hansschlegelia zhihuaiae]